MESETPKPMQGITAGEEQDQLWARRLLLLLGCSGHLDTHCVGPSMVSSGDARSKGISGDPQQAESEMHSH